MKRILLFFLLGLLALLSTFCVFSHSEEARETGAAREKVISQIGKDEYSNEQKGKNNSIVTLEAAKEFLGELLPLVERITGKTLQQNIEIMFVNQDEMKKILTDDFVLQYSALYTALKKEDIVKKARSTAAVTAKTLMAKYGFKEKIIFLVPQIIDQEIRRIKGNKSTEVSLYKQYISHELTHAIQDQELDFAKKHYNMTGAEERDSFSALIEGHAMLVQEMITKDLGLPPLSYQEKVLSSTIPLHHKASRDIWAYSKGKTFIQYFYDKGGNKRVWEILNAPPVRTAIVNKPQEYTHLPDASIPDYSRILHGMEKYLGKGKWLVENYELTQKDFWASLFNLGPKERDLILQQIKQSQAIRFIKKGNKPQFGNLSITLLKDPEFVDSYFSLFEKLIRSEQKLRMKSSLPRIKELEIEKFDLVTSGKTHKISYISQGRKKNKIVIVRVASNKMIIEINAVNLKLSDKTINEIVELISQRLVSANEQFGEKK